MPTDRGGTVLETCSILTTAPNDVTAAIHDRMPVIMDPETYDPWLDPGMKDSRILSDMPRPYDARQMRSCPVSSRINHVGNDDEECSRRVEPSAESHIRERNEPTLGDAPSL